MNRRHRYFGIVVYLVVAAWFVPAYAGSYEDFFAALEKDDAGGVSALLKRGFDPNTRNSAAQPALTRALQAGSLKVAEVLMAHPQTEIDIVNEAGETPLMLAALKGHLDAATKLLGKGAKAHRGGWSPIHYAATGPEPRLVALLIGRGAPLEPMSPTQRTPLMMAAMYGAEESARLLVERGSDPKRRNEAGESAADFARRAGRDALGKWLEAGGR